MKAILVDDEQLALDFLERKLHQIGNVQIIDKFIDPLQAKNCILRSHVDVVFLDIHLPEINGLQLAEQIMESKPNITIVFVTIYDQYAVHAFEINALDYVVKPLQLDRLHKTVSRINARLAMPQQESPGEKSKIQVNVCRQLTIVNEAGKAETLSWRTARAQELFLYLLQNREQPVRKSVLIDLFWNDCDLDKIYPLLYTTVYNMRKTLKRYSHHFYIQSTKEGYILRTEDVTIDVEEWERRLNSAQPLILEAVEEYEEIMNVYTGAYLQEYDYWWAEAERHRLEQTWLDFSFQLAELYQKKGDIKKAIHWYTNICNQQPGTEEAYVALMKLYAMEGNPKLVDQQFDQLNRDMLVELNITPSLETIQWYNHWKKVSK
ncbi:MAG: response regulator [Bacillota bacterium]|uniref:Response regulator n=1 Tax=Virgibacillus salarius TaxID=447199 RepID=A0A941DVX1_9BACI|nr:MULTISPECIES: response regulator [Virgibacillus]NAZ07909.1 response regulator [Agaribacter marinus]MBR7795193.1 response regulator [Virgibacillus salarius]MCC2249398.1 response regulator [Virgibacillus sp. AGTR]MDY7043013.1 response regulator [Virgibacillus sp. M23]QRZ18809.1 response regulator [Virgibacillus sp. AGTR]